MKLHVSFYTRSPGSQGEFHGLCILPSLLSKPGQNDFQDLLQDLRANILQPAANAHDQTVIIQTGGGTNQFPSLLGQPAYPDPELPADPI